MKKKKNETKSETKNKTTKSDTIRDSVSLEKGKASKKSSSGAGKGDKLRRGISQEEWGDNWEKIFRKKKRDVKIDN